MGRATFTARVETRQGGVYRRAARGLRRLIGEEFRSNLGPRLLRISRRSAPHDGGALQRGLRSFATGFLGRAGVEIRSTVRSEDGYNYTGVTRVGHRVAFIEPKHSRALRTPWGPRKRVRGYKPTHDWADDAHLAAQPEVERSGRRIGRQLQAEVG